MASLTIRPGSWVRLKGQDDHVPDFMVVRCDRDRCWLRQQTWGPEAELTVRFSQILVPEVQGNPRDAATSRPSGAATVTTTTSPWGTATITSGSSPSPSRPASNVIYLDAYRRRRAR
jgi:hypothetical protein